MCGAALLSAAEAPRHSTVVVDSSMLASDDTPDSIDHGSFLPGTIIADRYRIVALLGKGGMGEVYRADDLKLGQVVALKFLPADLADNPRRRERFHHEVRIARQVAHPNLCRVYDIGEVEGHTYL
jgi:serine/threonine protein kinase